MRTIKHNTTAPAPRPVTHTPAQFTKLLKASQGKVRTTR